jgi:TIM-barrel protein
MLALASLSGQSDAAWARAGADHAELAFLGGIALDADARAAARELVAREREEFLPSDPLAFVAAELDALADAPIRPGVNVRATSPAPIRAAARLCADRDAVVEVNAHCRQDELCAVGCGEALLRDAERLARYVAVANEAGAATSVKVRAEVPGVDLPALARRVENAGADVIHVDAMDAEPVVGAVADACDLFILANNGVRDRSTAWEYLRHGADGVSVGRPSDDSEILRRVRRAVDAWERRREDGPHPLRPGGRGDR